MRAIEADLAAGVEDEAIAGLDLTGCMGSLKELIEKNRTVSELPEMFCFGAWKNDVLVSAGEGATLGWPPPPVAD